VGAEVVGSLPIWRHCQPSLRPRIRGTGPGRLAVDRFLPGLRIHRLAYGAGAVAVGLVTAGVILLVRN